MKLSIIRTARPRSIGQVSFGPVSLVTRGPAVLWDGTADVAVINTGPIGFAGASESDRSRWLNGFRRLLDGLDAPLQVLIEIDPGPGVEEADPAFDPADFGEMRSADVRFAARISQSPSAHRRRATFVTASREASRLESGLCEMGIVAETTVGPPASIFGKQSVSHFAHAGGWSKTWCIERMPGTELEPGWLFRLAPRGLKVTVAWHATPLPAAWIVGYLQRQLISMRAARLQEQEAGRVDPGLAGALPNAEELQRRLAASQEKAFHVSVYVTLTSATEHELGIGSAQVEAAARALLCELQPCTFRMFDGYLATRPTGIDRLERRRVLDTSALVTFFPWLDAELQQPGGLVVGTSQATGAPVLVDPFDQQRYANAKALG